MDIGTDSKTCSDTSLPADAAAPAAGGARQILVTGASGFIGTWVVRTLLSRGYTRLRCLTRASAGVQKLEKLRTEFRASSMEVIQGNLLSQRTCDEVAQGVELAYHLAAGVEKSFPGCFLNSAVTTRNLVEALLEDGSVKRLVNVSSLSVYSSESLQRGDVLDETCPIETKFVERHDAYAYGKAKQDELVREYGRTRGLQYVIARPGLTIGPGKAKIPGRVGIDSFGVFLHLGLGNQMPFTYVENCAEAIILAGLVPGIEREEINIIDDNLPSSSFFLKQYKRRVTNFRSLSVPYWFFYILNMLWEKYSVWSDGQLPPVFNRRACESYYKSQRFSNAKAKAMLGWAPRVGMKDALDRFYAFAKQREV